MSHSQKISELSPAEKRQLLADLLRKKAQSSQDWHPLSYGQQALWLIYKLAPESTVYNIGLAMRLRSSVDFSVLKRALRTLIDRHSMLRVTFKEEDGKPLQSIQPHLVLPWEDIDATGWSEEQLKEQVREKHHQPFNLEQEPVLRISCFHHSDVDYVLLISFHHIACDGWSIWLLLDELKQLYIAESENKKLSLSPVNSSYLDYIHSQRQMLKSAIGEDHWKYWQRKLEGELPLLNLSTDYPRPAIQTYQGSSCSFQLSPQLSQQLKTLAKTESVTPYILLLAAFQVLLYRYSGSEDILIGSPTTGRTNSDFTSLVGYLVNPVVLRANCAGNPKFSEFLPQVRQTVAEAIARQDYPFPLLVEQLRPHRDPSYSPLFQVDFVLQQSHLSDTSIIASDNPENTGPIHWGNLILEPFPLPQQEGQFDLSLEMFEGKDSLIGNFKYNKDLFKENTISRLSNHFQILLEGIVTNPDTPIGEFPLLSAEEKRQILVEWNNTQRDYPQDQCIHQLFEEQVLKNTEAIALVYQEKQLTYQQLNEKANQLAHYLQELGVTSETLVGICVERSVEMVIGILAILKAGGAYVPLDPNYPLDRLEYMLRDAQVNILLTQSQLLSKIPFPQGQTVCLDAHQGLSMNTYSRENPISPVKTNNLAYVIYTSGSTGKPKGVAIEHHSTITLLYWSQEIFSPEELRGVLASTSICFDLSVFELFLPLACGGKVILAKNALELPNLKAYQEVTLINTVPSAIAQLLQLQAIPPNVRTINLAGEPLSNQLAQKLYQLPNIERVYNLYGPSEDTTYSTFSYVQKGATEEPTIGRPIANTQIYILDRDLQPVPLGVIGELYIGGEGLARCYLNQPELTDQKFVESPLTSGKLYKTGDLVRYLADGQIAFLGRIDHQVKIRGFRIELGEIEACIREHPDVKEVVVLARDTQTTTDKRLVAYIVSSLIPERLPYHQECLIDGEGKHYSCHIDNFSIGGLGLTEVNQDLTVGQIVRLYFQLPGQEQPQWLLGKIVWIRGKQSGIEFQLQPEKIQEVKSSFQTLLKTGDLLKVEQRILSNSLKNYLKKKLPEYMIPSAFVILDSFPLTPNGKIDRKALPSPDLSVLRAGELVSPQTPTEQILADIWVEVLKVHPISIYDNFFELGGDSILSLQIIARANQKGLKIAPKQIFQYQTIASLAPVVESTLPADTLPEVTSLKGEMPLTPIMYWFFEQKFPNPHHFNQSLLLTVSPELSPELLTQVLQELVEHHDTLRLRFFPQGNQWQAGYSNLEKPITISVIELSNLPPEQQSIAITETASQLQASLDFTQGEILKVALFKLGDNQSDRLLIIIHHLVIDGVSWRILLEDLTLACQQLNQSQKIQLPPKTSSLKTWSEKLHQYAQSQQLKEELTYWLELTEVSITPLPLDDPENLDKNTEESADSVTVFLPEKETQLLLKEVPSVYKTQIYEILLTALAQSFLKWTGNPTLLVDLEGHGREDLFNEVDVSRTLGWFTTLFPLLLKLPQNGEIGENIKAIKEQIRQIPKRGIGYGILRYLTPDSPLMSQQQTLPHPQISFNYLGQFDQMLSGWPILGMVQEAITHNSSPQNHRSHCIEVNGWILEGRLKMDWIYSQNLHQKATVEKIAQDFLQSLESLIAHCQSPEAGGYTPSDFVAAKLNQKQIDKLMAKFQQKKQK